MIVSITGKNKDMKSVNTLILSRKVIQRMENKIMNSIIIEGANLCTTFLICKFTPAKKL